MLSPEQMTEARKTLQEVRKTKASATTSSTSGWSPMGSAPKKESAPLKWGSSSAQETSAPTEGAGFLDKAKNTVKSAQQAHQDFLVGQAKGVGSSILGAAELGSGLLEKGYNATIGKLTGKEAQKGSELAGELKEGYTTPTNTAQSVGKATEQIGEFFVPMGAAGKIDKAIDASKVLAKAPKAIKTAVGIGSKALVEGTEQAARTAVQEGELNSNVATAGVVGAAAPVLEKTISSAADKLGNFFYSRAVPTTIKEAAKDVSRELDVGEAVSKTGVSLTKKSLMNKVRQEAVGLGKQLDNAIDTYMAGNPASNKIDDFTNSVRGVLDSPAVSKALKMSPVDEAVAKEAIEARLVQYEDLFKDKQLSAQDIQKLKVSMGEGLEKVYQQALDAPIKAKALADINLRTTLKKHLEEVIPEVAGINKKLAPLLEAEGRMLKKGAYSGYLTDLVAGGFASGSAGDIIEDPVGAVKRFALGVIAKRLGTSTAAKTIAGTVTKDLGKFMASPQAMQIIRRLIQGVESDESE